MTGTSFQKLLRQYGLRHVDAAELLGVTTRSIERYVASDDVPRIVVSALRWELQQAGREPVKR